jgi:small subunit ribosomal protein S17
LEALKKPSRTCDDPNCPFHGKLRIRGRLLEGVVVSDKMEKSASIRIDSIKYLPKYERYERRHSKITAHNPPCIDAKRGDKVKIVECRPLSKTKAFVIVEKTGE